MTLLSFQLIRIADIYHRSIYLFVLSFWMETNHSRVNIGLVINKKNKHTH